MSLLRVPTPPGASRRPVPVRGERLPERLEAADGDHHG